MKDGITQADVLNAIQQLRAAGKNPTARAIHATLGRGSFTTILSLRREIDSSSPIQTAEPDKGAQEHFLQVWHTAYTAGFNSRDAEVQDLKESLEGVRQEAEALQASEAAAQRKLAEAQEIRDNLAQQLTETTRQANEARLSQESYAADLAAAARSTQKLVDALEENAKLTTTITELRRLVEAKVEVINQQRNDHFAVVEELNALKEEKAAQTQTGGEKKSHSQMATESIASSPSLGAPKKTVKKTLKTANLATPDRKAGFTEENSRKLIESDSTPQLPLP